MVTSRDVSDVLIKEEVPTLPIEFKEFKSACNRIERSQIGKELKHEQ